MGFRWILSNIPVLTGIFSFIQIFFIMIEINMDMNFNSDVESEPQFRVKRGGGEFKVVFHDWVNFL